MKQEPTKKPIKNVKRQANYYGVTAHSYESYWQGRKYEQRSEELAIRRLLKGRHFAKAIDLGGDYGRLAHVVREYTRHLTLIEPTELLQEIAEHYTAADTRVDSVVMSSQKLAFQEGSIDLILMIRVMERLADPSSEFAEIARVLNDDGYAIIEVANYVHAANRIRHIAQMKHVPSKPIDMARERPTAITAPWATYEPGVPFYSHNPETVIKQLALAGLRVEKTLSVSNLRNPFIKRVLAGYTALKVESALQSLMANSYLGPSIFFLVKKATS